MRNEKRETRKSQSASLTASDLRTDDGRAKNDDCGGANARQSDHKYGVLFQAFSRCCFTETKYERTRMEDTPYLMTT